MHFITNNIRNRQQHVTNGDHFTSERFQSISFHNVLAPDYTTERFRIHTSRYYVSKAKVYIFIFSIVISPLTMSREIVDGWVLNLQTQDRHMLVWRVPTQTEPLRYFSCFRNLNGRSRFKRQRKLTTDHRCASIWTVENGKWKVFWSTSYWNTLETTQRAVCELKVLCNSFNYISLGQLASSIEGNN